MEIYRLNPEARIPTLGTELSAGYDLYCIEDQELLPGRNLIKTGISISLPQNTYGRITDRSSMALKSLHVTAGVIDPDYRGEIVVIMENLSSNTVNIRRYDRIAQLIVEVILRPEIKISEVPLELTNRKGGFGSTGQ